jgi:predicted nucleic acid-binding Zn ribbon protein
MPFPLPPFPSIPYLRPMGQYSIGDAIKQFLNQSRMKGSIQAMQIEDVWESIMGKTIARYTDNLKVINKTLFITTNVAPLKQELIYQKEKIKLRVNEALGGKVIEDIVIQ